MRTVSAVSHFFDRLRTRRDIISFGQRGVEASAPEMDCFNTIADNLDASVRTFAGESVPDRDAVCAEADPDITARYFELVDTLMEEPVNVLGQPSTGEDLFMLLDNRNHARSQNPNKLSTYLPLMISQLEDGDVTLLSQVVGGQLPPVVTPDSLLAQAKARGLSGDEQALVNAAATAARVMEINSDLATSAIGQLESDLTVQAERLELAELFDDALEDATNALATRDDRIAVGSDYLNLRFADPEPALLTAFVVAHFEGTTRAQLISLMAAMDEADIARVFELIGLDNQALEDAVEGEFEALVYACQEDFVDGLNSAEGYRTETASLSIGPAFDAAMTAEVPVFYTICDEVFTPAPRAGWPDPVDNDATVLLMNGEIDVQTSYAWGAMAAQTLSNSRNLVLPESGHGTILFSQCARDITAAYIDNADAELNTSCIADLRPPVMLPDGTMHPLPL